METWKRNLNVLLNKHGYFKINEWNQLLNSWITEWIKEINRADGLKATVERNQNGFEIKIQFYKLSYAYKFYIQYTVNEMNEMILIIEYTPEGFLDYSVEELRSVLPKNEKYAFPKKVSERLTGVNGSVLEKENVLSFLTSRFSICIENLSNN